MSNTLGHLLRSVPDTNLADFNYPVASYTEILQGDGIQIHRIIGTGAPSTNYAKAPNGSTYIDMTLNTGAYYIKTGTIGKIDGTWKYVAVTT
jgi:hypothetical protein